MDSKNSVVAVNQAKEQLTNGDMNGLKIPNGLRKSHKSYSETLIRLMEFDNNTSVLKRVNPKNIKESSNKLNLLIQLLDKINIKLDHLNKLNVIHIAGTKGKGSTCAYVERILRERGYKTGLYTSPHLVSVRDRIRISGQPISMESFVDYFWSVEPKIAGHDEKPGFFMFLTLLSFHIFLEEKVDVTILETGIGGEFDCTNIVPAPIVTGITSLGIDHTTVLGDTLESIAWHKAGILKPNVTCFSSPQPESAIKVIQDRAREKNCPLFVCPTLDEYQKLTPGQISLGIDGQAQKTNASLALKLSRYWHDNHKVKFSPSNGLCEVSSNDGNSFPLTSEEIHGLEDTTWPGRCQLVTRGSIKYFLDGAHTVESLDNCLEWYNRKSREIRQSDGPIVRVLCFFSAGLRQFEPLIQRVAHEKFDFALFPSNHIDQPEKYPEIMTDSRYGIEDITDRITKTRLLWQSIQRENGRDSVNCKQFTSLSKTLNYLETTLSSQLSDKQLTDSLDDCKLHVLVTGSLVFVGNVLTLIDDSNKSYLNG
ncbi:folylpolyglutamate synthase, mitochondrial-like isoform X2 [Panonychus citri]|nr:folylpolyglutamate synthase, mitochondrial-like isoform X2 [Panonychus citri]XP_053205092.1 folylpolyglutamate synthase, mitochondrial-like isoform X2 [Panonychus citri]